MNFKGEKVTHKTFGEGIIKSHKGDYIYVSFPCEKELKQFDFRKSFGSFITYANPELANQILREKRDLEQKEEAKKEAKRLEQDRLLMYAKNANHKSTSSTKTVKIQPYNSVEEFCDVFSVDVSKEVQYLRANEGTKYKAFEGERIGYVNNTYIYSFETETELFIPDGTQIKIISVSGTPDVTISVCEEFNMIINSAVNLDNTLTEIEFTIEMWRLLSSLNDRLSEVKETYSEITQALVCDGNNISALTNNITKGQKSAIEMANSQPVTFIWGPPGTGKTETLAQIAIEHIEAGNRVLMLSYSNVSVDGAIWRIHEIQNNKGLVAIPGQVVRYGYPRMKELLNHEHLTSFNFILHKYPALAHERQELFAEQKRLQKDNPRRLEIQNRLKRIRADLADEEQKHIYEADFVATTISKTVVDKTLYGQKFDVVIFDEASMAYIPHIVFSCNLAKKYFICIGDFNQLPPIVLSGKESKLNADIFQYCGISKAVDIKRGHKWLCLLDTQYRMHPSIADFVSDNMYNRLLKSAGDLEFERNAIAENSPLPNNAIGLMDLSGMMSVCKKTSDQSRVNALSAFISCVLAAHAGARHSVGVISPYRAQSRLIHAMLKDISESSLCLKPISSATVHQYQGSERDVIIYDSVDCYRMTYPGTLLTSKYNDYSNRLFNVAITRAKGKFIAVTNASYMKTKKLSNKYLFGKLLEFMIDSQARVGGQDFIENGRLYSNDVFRVFSGADDANDSFFDDITCAKREIRIDIPGKMINDDTFFAELANIIDERKSKGVKVFIRTSDKNIVPTHLRNASIQNNYVYDPIAIIDMKTIWFGMPHSLDSFQVDGADVETLYRPVIRFDGKHASRCLFGLMQMSQTLEQISSDDIANIEYARNFAEYVVTHTKCSKCDSYMNLKKKRNFYLACLGYPSCKNTELVAFDLVRDYLWDYKKGTVYCPKDKTNLEVKLGKYGIFLTCNGRTKHTFGLDEI